jgi:hypothetical protein
LGFRVKPAAADYERDHGSNKNSKLHLLHCGVHHRLRSIMSQAAPQVLRNSSGSLAMFTAIRRASSC